MKVKCVLFGIDDVLFDASLQKSSARLNAIKAMIGAGLPTEVETTYRVLQTVVKEYGTDYNKHFDALLEQLGLKWNPQVIAAGVAAYRETSSTYLKPYADTFPTLLKLREKGYKLGAISEGRAVKQWQKLIELGIQHLFDRVLTSDKAGVEAFTPELFKSILKKSEMKPQQAIFVGSRPEPEISSANKARVTSIRIRRGENRTREPESAGSVPKFEIGKLSEIFNILRKIEKTRSSE